jgi:hypothetical protein
MDFNYSKWLKSLKVGDKIGMMAKDNTKDSDYNTVLKRLYVVGKGTINGESMLIAKLTVDPKNGNFQKTLYVTETGHVAKLIHRDGRSYFVIDMLGTSAIKAVPPCSELFESIFSTKESEA